MTQGLGIANPSNEATVPITVGKDTPADKLPFLIPKAVSTKDAVGTVRGGLVNVAAVTAGNPNAASLDFLLNPVFDVDNFAANTAFGPVTKTFDSLFTDFFGTFRGGL